MRSYRNTQKIETKDAPSVILDIYSKLNDRFFGGVLPGIQILLTPNIREIMHFEKNAKFVFNRTSESVGHLNVSASALSLSPNDFCAALLHEMCHQYCFINGIKDTSRGDTYHNKAFRDIALTHGLLVIRNDTYGYAETAANTELMLWCLQNMTKRPIDIIYYKSSLIDSVISKPAKKIQTNSHSIKYQCPVCGWSVRATKRKRVACMDCGNIQMIETNTRYLKEVV